MKFVSAICSTEAVCEESVFIDVFMLSKVLEGEMRCIADVF